LDRLTASWQDFSARARDFFGNLGAGQRLAAGLVGIALVIGLGAWAVFYGPLHKEPYAVLFSNLNPDDSASILQKLKDDKVPYQITDGGTTIKVPQASLYDERVQIAGSNLLKGGGTGYELFDKTNLGMTDFQEKVALTRAVEGELQRTIDGLSSVQSSRVHIAKPDETLYSSVQAPTTASVVVKTKPGLNLDSEQVLGITDLVSYAVPGLKPENVTIVNQDGNILVPRAAPGSNVAEQQASALQLTQEQLIAKERYEANLQESIQGMLDQTLGPHRAAARVAVDMNFDTTTSDSQTYAPTGTVRSEQTERESYNGQVPNRSPAVGVPGTTTNVIGTYQGLQTAQSGRYNRNKTTRNYEITQTNTKHILAPGKVTRLSVAVLVNVPNAAPLTAGANAPYAVAATDVTKIRNVVSAAAGIDPTRGDIVSVEAVPFNPAVVAEAPRPGLIQITPTVFGIPASALIALGIVALLIAVGAGALAVRRRRPAFHPPEELPTFDSTLAEELPPFQEHPMLDQPPGLAAPIRSAADLTREQMIEYVTTVAQENPESIAKLLKLWMAE
jgi:flagellar M-ring protein FliF